MLRRFSSFSSLSKSISILSVNSTKRCAAAAASSSTSSSSPTTKTTTSEDQQLAQLNAKYTHPNVIPGRPDMTVVDWQDVELDKEEAAKTGEEIYRKRAERRTQEQNSVLENQLRSGRFERVRDWIMIIGSMFVILFIVPKFVTAFKILMENRTAKIEFGPVEKPEDYDDATGKSPTLDAAFPRRLNFALKPGASLAGSMEATSSVFTNKSSAFQTAKFKNTNTAETAKSTTTS